MAEQAPLSNCRASRTFCPRAGGKLESCHAWCPALREAEFVVGRFVPEGRTGIASLLIGQPDDESKLVYVGSVSAGVRATRGLEAVLPSLMQDKSGLLRRRNHKIDRAARWVAPLLIATVRYLDWTAEGLLRQPVLCGLRVTDRTRGPSLASDPQVFASS